MTHNHNHNNNNNDHDHDDPTRSHLSDVELRVRTLQTLFVEKGYIEPAALDLLIDTYEKRIGPRNGAQVVARAWTDPDYRRWLLEDGTAAIASLGYRGRQGEHMVVLENTPAEHNVIVCTLCSCYPWPVLGLPPSWFKSFAYRSRVVIDPRSVLAEFGLQLPEETTVRVWDSTSEMRYMVLPMQPVESQGLSEEALVDWVTRNSMIGTGLPQAPQEQA